MTSLKYPALFCLLIYFSIFLANDWMMDFDRIQPIIPSQIQKHLKDWQKALGRWKCKYHLCDWYSYIGELGKSLIVKWDWYFYLILNWDINRVYLWEIVDVVFQNHYFPLFFFFCGDSRKSQSSHSQVLFKY